MTTIQGDKIRELLDGGWTIVGPASSASGSPTLMSSPTGLKFVGSDGTISDAPEDAKPYDPDAATGETSDPPAKG